MYSLFQAGGVKGFQQAEMVREFEEQTGQPLYKTFQVIAGTSVGGPPCLWNSLWYFYRKTTFRTI
ncbi:MAG: hypothetical protein ACE1S7_00145 [Candidatus Tisiphia sp.]